jgi:cytochrome c5
MMKNAKRAIALVLGLSILGLGIAYAKQDEMVEKAIQERIQPFGKVNTGGAVVASSGARSGKEIVEGTCAACHGTGALGSPKVHNKADWAPRLKQGMDTLLKHAIHGIRSMPPRGGNPDLSDADLKAAIKYMTTF